MKALPAPGSALGRYRLDRFLGRGGMGAVYLGYDTALHRPVAIKVLEARVKGPDSGKRALLEARSASALSHPNICTVFEVGEAEGASFIAMEFVDGRSIRDRLHTGLLETEEALRYGLQTADALAHAHERGVVHRDVKAANAIIADSGWLKLVDFGLAHRDDRSGSEEDTLELTGPTDMVAGTPYSMAPEQVRGVSAGSPADVWALGVLLYEMIAGDKPFQGSTNAEIIASVLRDQPRPLPPAVADDLRQLIRLCLDKDPAARSTAADVRDRIKAILGRRRPRGTAAATAPRPRERRRVLVLPFANISADPDTDYFADGLTEEVIADLSRIGSLMVISRTSAMKLKARTDDIRTMAGKMGVDLVLDGSVRKGRDGLRISVQLVDAAIDSLLWAEKFKAGNEDLLEVQERLSRQIIEAMQITLTRSETDQVASRPIAVVRVYDIYLRARHLLIRFSAKDLDESVALLQEGLGILKGNPLLLAQLGHTYLMYVHWAIRPDPAYLDKAQQCADQILTQHPGSSHGHGLCGGLEIKRGNLQGAVRHLKEAIRADPSNIEAVTWLAYAYMSAGQPESARPLSEMLVKIDPLTALNHVFYGWLFVVAGDPEAALPHYRRGYDLDPGAPLLNFLWGLALSRTPRTAEAIAHFEQVSKTAAGSVFGDLAAGFRWALLGDADATRRAVTPMTESAGRADADVARLLAQMYGLIGDADRACTALEHCVARGNLDYPGFVRDPALRSLQAEPRFQQLVADVKRRWDAFEV
jgi:serine/threonine protein kinase/tetratricopeptide (TPR) repeat protein